MKTKLIWTLSVLLLSSCATFRRAPEKKAVEPWCGLHLLGFYTDSTLAVLEQQLPQLSAAGINTLVLEVDYHFTYQSHPELRQT